MRISQYVWPKSAGESISSVCLCKSGRVRERAEVATSLRNGRMVRRASIDVSEIRRLVERGPRSRAKNGLSARVANGLRRDIY